MSCLSLGELIATGRGSETLEHFWLSQLGEVLTSGRVQGCYRQPPIHREPPAAELFLAPHANSSTAVEKSCCK